MNNKSNSLFESKQVKEALVQSLCKAKPKNNVQEPVMFTVEIELPLCMPCVCIAILFGAITR
jgi:K+-transporting ATPase ATPase B chain